MNKKQIGPFSLQELVISNSLWQLYKAKHTSTNQLYTIKQVSVQNYLSNPLLEDVILNEIDCMKNISLNNSINFQRFEGTLKSQNNIYLIYEKFHESTIGPIPLDKVVQCFNQLLFKVNQIHMQGYIHGDIHQGNVKLIDQENYMLTGGYFYRQDGIQTLLDASRENNPNFNTFLPPEIIKGYKVTTAVDIYQLGILFYYILYGTYPFQGEALAEKEQLNLKLYNHVQVSSVIKQTIVGMLQGDQNKRFTYKQVSRLLNNNNTYTNYEEDDYTIIQDKLNISKMERENIRKELTIDLLPSSLIGEPILISNVKSINKAQSTKINYQSIQHDRNKYIYLINVSSAILDMNPTECCLASSLIITRLAYLQISSLLQKIQDSNFWKIVDEEQNQIIKSFDIQLQQAYSIFKIDEVRFNKCFNDKEALQDGELQILFNYTRELKNNLKQIENQTNNKYKFNVMVHLNNVLDSIDVGRFFKDFMAEDECCLEKQPYFRMIETLTDKELGQLIDMKIKELKIII